MTITKPETEFDIGIDEECPICAQNLPFNAAVRAAIAEGDAIFFGEKPAKWYNSFEEGCKDLGI
jgi:hypothetical protein